MLCCNNFSFRRDHTTLVSVSSPVAECSWPQPACVPLMPHGHPYAHPIHARAKDIERDCIVTSTPVEYQSEWQQQQKHTEEISPSQSGVGFRVWLIFGISSNKAKILIDFDNNMLKIYYAKSTHYF